MRRGRFSGVRNEKTRGELSGAGSSRTFMSDTYKEKIRMMQLEFGTIEILQVLKAGIVEDLDGIDEDMKDPDPRTHPDPETKKDLEVYERELQGVIDRLEDSETLRGT
jgi:hypothetical protein